MIPEVVHNVTDMTIFEKICREFARSMAAGAHKAHSSALSATKTDTSATTTLASCVLNVWNFLEASSSPSQHQQAPTPSRKHFNIVILNFGIFGLWLVF